MKMLNMEKEREREEEERRYIYINCLSTGGTLTATFYSKGNIPSMNGDIIIITSGEAKRRRKGEDNIDVE